MSQTNGQNGHHESPDLHGGSGGKTDRTETGRTLIQDERMLSLAIRRGWLKGQRWPTDATVEELVEVGRQRNLTVRERATIAVARDVASDDSRVRQIAVRNAVAMESQNQADEKTSEPEQHLHLHKHEQIAVYIPDNARNARNGEG